MTEHEIEKHLKHLGRATEPADSIVPGVMQRILDVPQFPRRVFESRLVIRAAGALLAIAACVGALLVLSHTDATSKPRPDVVIAPQTHPATARRIEEFPSLADYRHAFARSPDSFEALLQQPASEASHKPEPELRVTDVSRSNLMLYQ